MTVRPPDPFVLPGSELWRGFRVPGGPHADLLQQAIRLGRQGRRAAAYRALAAYHEVAARSLVDLALKHGKSTPPVPPAACRRFRRDLARTHGTAAARHILEQLADVGQALALQALRAPDPSRADLLRALIRGCFAWRRTGIFHRYPLGGQLGLYNHFMTLWLAYQALQRLRRLDARTAEMALTLMIGMARIVYAKSERYIVHNIFTAGCYGLFFAARHLPEWHESADWDRRAVSHMALDFSRSFFKDGGHAERNWGYAAHTIARLTHVFRFGLATGGLYGKERCFREGLRRAYRYYAFTMGPNDFCPGFGDEGLRPFGFIFDRALQSGVFPAGTRRDLGVDRSRSYWLKSSGFAILRNGATSGSTYANLTLGDYAGWHSHQDLLSLNLWSHGRVLLEEVVRFGMYEHPMDVLWRADQAHNQLLVDTFFYDCRPRMAEDIRWYSDRRLDYCSAVHRAYRHVPAQEHRVYHNSANLLVRRTVLFIKDPGYLFVLDSVQNEDAPSFNRATSQYWHSPLPIRVLGPGRAMAGGRSGGCMMAWAWPERMRRLERTQDFRAEETRTTVHAPVFRSWHCLRARTWMPENHGGCLGFAAVLFPCAGRMPDLAIRALPTPGWEDYREGRFEIRHAAGRDVLAVNPEGRALRRPDGRRFSGHAEIILGGRRGSVRIR